MAPGSHPSPGTPRPACPQEAAATGVQDRVHSVLPPLLHCALCSEPPQCCPHPCPPTHSLGLRDSYSLRPGLLAKHGAVCSRPAAQGHTGGGPFLRAPPPGGWGTTAKPTPHWSHRPDGCPPLPQESPCIPRAAPGAGSRGDPQSFARGLPGSQPEPPPQAPASRAVVSLQPAVPGARRPCHPQLRCTCPPACVISQLLRGPPCPWPGGIHVHLPQEEWAWRVGSPPPPPRPWQQRKPVARPQRVRRLGARAHA